MSLIGPVFAPKLFREFEVDDFDFARDSGKAIGDALDRAKLYVRQWGERHGPKIVIRRSKDYPRRRVYLGCSLDGKPRRRGENTSRHSDKNDCPFSAVIIYDHTVWTVWSSLAEHNHGSSSQNPTTTENEEVQENGRPRKRQRRVGRVDTDASSFVNYQLPS